MNFLTIQIGNRFVKTLLLVVFLISGLVTVSAAEQDKKTGNVSRGAISWAQNCARCHEIRDPKEFTDAMWRPIVAHMRIRAGLTGQQQRDILAFLQSANNPTPKTVTTNVKISEAVKPSQSGKAIFSQTCIACHGANGKGVLPGTPDFTKADGRLSKSDDVLIKHITEGFQSPGSPMAMPAKGGNADLNDADIKAVLSYLKESFGQ